MPRIPTSQMSLSASSTIAPIPKTPSISAMMAPGKALAEGPIQTFNALQEAKKNEEAARLKAKKAEEKARLKAEKQQSEAFVNPLGSEAMIDWNLTRDKIIQQKGPGEYSTNEDMSTAIDEYIAKVSSGAPSAYATLEAEKALYRIKMPFMKSFIKNQGKAFKDHNNSVLSDSLDDYRTQIRTGDNWTNPNAYLINGVKAITGSSWLSTPEQMELIRDFKEGTSSDVLTGWHKSNADKIGASEMIRNGKINEAMQPYLNNLDADQRDELADELLKDHNELLRAENAQYKIDERNKEQSVNKILLDFFSTSPSTEGTASHASRIATIAALRRSNAVSPTVLLQMEDFVSGKETLDDERIESQVLADIYSGKIRSIGDMISYVGNGISFRTFGDKYVPLIQAQQDKRFRSASNYLKNRLGIPEGGFLNLTLDPNSKERKRMTALSSLQKEYARNPDIDLFKKAEDIVAKIEQQELVDGQNQINKLINQRDALLKQCKKSGNEALCQHAADIQTEIDYLGR